MREVPRRKRTIMKKQLVLLIVLQLFTHAITSQVRVGADSRRFVYGSYNRSFFWLGDTGWELFHRLNREEAELYLKTRASQGFNVIQAVVLAELDGLHQPNAYGHLPLENDDPLKPGEDYFRHVDWVIDKAKEYNIYIALLPTWGDKVFKNTWGAGPEIFNPANAKSYGKWIAERYKNRSNIIWILGGDRNPRNQADVDIWLAMGLGIVEGIGTLHDPLISYHPQPSATSSSSPWFHNQAWFDFNMLQTGHCRDVKVWEKIAHDYNLTPTKPVVNGEPIYEDHPVCFNAKELGHSNVYDIRKATYLSVFAGAAGVTYGCHAVWQFYAPPRAGVNGPLKTWQESLNLPAATQMVHLKNLFTRHSLKDLKPDQRLLVDTLEGTRRIQALVSAKHVLVYSAAGEPIRFKPDQLAMRKISQARWYDPRSGSTQKINRRAAMKANRFTPPSSGDGNDWVLILRR
jgi:hypothetical protein